MILAGNVALESMGLKPSASRAVAPTSGNRRKTSTGSRKEWLATSEKANSRYSGDRKTRQPAGRGTDGLIYVNPEGPDGKPDPVASGRDVRETFGRMAMNDEETVALVAGGHTFGKHGASDPKLVGPEPKPPIEAQGFGLDQRTRFGQGVHTTTSGIEARGNRTRRNGTTAISMLFGYEMGTHRRARPARTSGWRRTASRKHDPRRARPEQKHPPMMTTADLSLRFDPAR